MPERTSSSTKDPLVAKLTARRQELGLTQEAVAAIAGISRRTLAGIETGGNCTLSTLRQIAQALEVDLMLSSETQHASEMSPPTLDDMNELNRRERFGSPRG